RVKKFVLKHSNRVCVNSIATKSACEEIYRRDYDIVPMGVDIHNFKPVEASNRLVQKYNLSGFTVLFVGRLTEVKGIIYLLEALKLLKKDGYNFKALIVGEGPLKATVKTYLEKN